MSRTKFTIRKKIWRILSMYIALNMFAEYIIPIKIFALTGGPSQPEVESFEPVGTTDMVNLFTGDFNYNIPLLTVPGPNGGYPINMAYHAGAGMEDEASWVGLGWNINPGVVNRNMRGLPDDFDGDLITKTMYYKPQETWTMDYSSLFSNKSLDSEIVGFESKPIFSYQIHYNNYKGLGLGISMNLTTENGNLKTHFSPGLNLSYDTDGGLGVAPSISYSQRIQDFLETFSVGIGYNSREGVQVLSWGSKNEKIKRRVSGCIPRKYAYQKPIITHSEYSQFLCGANSSFAFSSAIPNNSQAVTGSNWMFGIALGTSSHVSTADQKKLTKRFNLSLVSAESDEIEKPFSSYGFLYYQDAQNPANKNSLLDFNREKDRPANKNTSSIGVGYATQDMMYVSGQGVGGAFKPFRSETPLFYDAPVTNEFPGAKFQVDLAKNSTGNLQVQSGGDFGVNYARSYSGDWNSMLGGLASCLFEDYSSSDPLYEPVYYKSTGEMTASPLNEMDYVNGTKALRFDLRNILDNNDGILPELVDQMVSNFQSQTALTLHNNNKRITRQKRAQLMSYRTSGQIARTPSGYGHPIVSLYNTINEFPSTGGTPAAVDYSDYPEHHMGEITVTKPDGNRYVYGLPVYNKSQKEVMFTKGGISETDFSKRQTYTPGNDNAVGNAQGMDHFFMSTKIPEYAYSYLLTAIYSPDYVDLTGNGPTSDDFGYWVKFNYSKTQSDYGWRTPYRDASYSKNAISNPNDDKLSYMYGTKEIYYLNSIETKTHEARFILNTGSEYRHDGNGAPSEDFLGSDAMGSSNRLHFLKSIELVSKKDPGKIIKTVHFQYDYSLCGNVMNNDGQTEMADDDNDPTTAQVDINASHGKLTLRKVWFTYLSNNKGELSPYQFSYASPVPIANDNPDYSQDQMDRWGNYMPDRTVNGIEVNGNENPYVNQNTSGNPMNEYMGAWNLKKITLPSGGEINVTYESDDYAYVQDKPAMQMQSIAGMGSYTDVGSNGFATLSNNLLNDRNTIVFFNLEEPVSASLTDAEKLARIEPYVKDINELYFKTFLKLKKKTGHTGSAVDDFAYDYVDGYAHIDRSQTNWYGFGANSSGNITTGWVRITNEERNPWNSNSQTDQPFKLAGWQYLRMERNDLFDNGNLFDDNSSLTDVISGFVNLGSDFQRLLGYFNYCQTRSYCNEIYLDYNTNGSDLTHPKPSYIRLNSPDKRKYGGGHRVKKITISDNWDEMSGDTNPQTYEYGNTYEYTLPDGSSSGVAEYEPLIGGEEIPQRVPLRYAQRNYPYKNDGLYTEEPFGENLYPSPNVGYSRVVVKSSNNDNPSVTKNRSGISVTEFYTAKDFPVINTFTDLKKKNFAIPVIIPFVGEIGFNNKGYSQGFSLELNNMHGQVKSMSVYSANSDINNALTQPVSKTEYIYATDNPYSTEHANHLSNKVQVLDADAVYREADLGKTHEFYVDRQQHSDFAVSAGVQINMGVQPPYVFWGNAFPYFEISKSMYRSISTMKVVERNGVLSEVRNYKDGAFAIDKSLMYDAETGQALLTQTINNFDKPVYTYNYASHWAYNSMGGAYKNAGAKFFHVLTSGGIYNHTDAANYFVPGDEVEYEDPVSFLRTIYWVNSVNTLTGDVNLVHENGDPADDYTDGTFTILRSGNRNQQSATDGVIVSLSNPVTQRDFPLFDAFNSYNAQNVSSNAFTAKEFFRDCASGENTDVGINWTAPNHLQFQLGECTMNIYFPDGHGITDLQHAFDYNLAFSGSSVIATQGETSLTCTYDAGSCFQTCLDDVLHAEAYRNKDAWNFNYLDLGYPATYGVLSGQNLANGVPNDYRYGTKGIWRSETGWLYQVDRKQKFTSPSGTDIAKDGTYKNFVLYNWSSTGDPALANPNWTLTNTITQYSPYGFELENKDALNIYSSALYGYNNSLSTAVASNTQYRELAFDGFEDYTNPATYTSVATVPHGHLYFTSVNTGSPIDVNSNAAHTGTYALEVSSHGPAEMLAVVNNTASNQTLFNPVAGQQYHLSLWVNTTSDGQGLVTLEDVNGTSATTIATAGPDPKLPAIDGWRQINVDFTAPVATHTLRIMLSCVSATSADARFDDIRLQPYTSGMKSYVYDPNTLWLLAELDDRNFATFYNYDEEGALVQVKKETENGIVTIRASRSNTKRVN